MAAMLAVSLPIYAQTEIKINQSIWLEFSVAERAAIATKFPQIEVVPVDSAGIVQSVQTVNRSTAGTNSGAALGGVLGQAMYVDSAFKGSGSNYSATAQVGAALLGAALGSSVDKAPESRFIFNYGIKTLDGQIREVRVESADEFTRPIGQCVSLPSITPAAPSLCTTDKVQFLKKLSAISLAPADAIITPESTGVNVACRVPGVGLMTLEKTACIQMEGSIEK